MFPRTFASEDVSAHHGGGGQRDDHRNEDRCRQCNRELPKQSTHDPAHRQEWDEYGNQGDTDGENGETDLLSAFERGLKRG